VLNKIISILCLYPSEELSRTPLFPANDAVYFVLFNKIIVAIDYSMNKLLLTERNGMFKTNDCCNRIEEIIAGNKKNNLSPSDFYKKKNDGSD
jgi:hypothetical protein